MEIRDRDYVDWRYLQHPTLTYANFRAMKTGKMMDYVFLRKVGLLGFNSAAIAGLLAFDEDVLIILVRKGFLHSQGEGGDLLGFLGAKISSLSKTSQTMWIFSKFLVIFIYVYSYGGGEWALSPNSIVRELGRQ